MTLVFLSPQILSSSPTNWLSKFFCSHSSLFMPSFNSVPHYLVWNKWTCLHYPCFQHWPPWIYPQYIPCLPLIVYTTLHPICSFFLLVSLLSLANHHSFFKAYFEIFSFRRASLMRVLTPPTQIGLDAMLPCILHQSSHFALLCCIIIPTLCHLLHYSILKLSFLSCRIRT